MTTWAQASNYYVALSGSDATGIGTQSSPWATLQHAMTQTLVTIRPGDVIEVGGGIYHGTMVTVPSSLAGVTFENVPGQTPDLRGSLVMPSGSWVPSSLGANIYQCSNSAFANHPQQVYVNGQPLVQMGTIGYGSGGASAWNAYPSSIFAAAAVNSWAPGQFLWSSSNGGTIFVELPSSAPSPNPSDSRNLVEVSTSQWIFNSLNAIDVDVLGIKFSQCSSTSFSETGGGVIIGSNSTIASCTITQCDFAGILLQDDDTVGTSVVSSCLVNDNGDTGITANPPGSARGSILISYSQVFRNNFRGYNETWHAGGIKIIPNSYGRVESCEVAYNYGPGIWWDTNQSGEWSTTRNNYVHDNLANIPNTGNSLNNAIGILIELGYAVNVCNNVVSNNSLAGISVSASDYVQVTNNDVLNTGADCASANASNPNPDTPFAAIVMAGMPRPNNGETQSLVGNMIENNIVYNTRGSAADLEVQGNGSDPEIYGNTSDYNLYYNNLRSYIIFDSVNDQYNQFQGGAYSVPDWTAKTGLDAHSMQTNPLFVAGFGSYNYDLQSSSPARNAGANTGTGFDYYWRTRPAAPTPYDIGAFQTP